MKTQVLLRELGRRRRAVAGMRAAWVRALVARYRRMSGRRAPAGFVFAGAAAPGRPGVAVRHPSVRGQLPAPVRPMLAPIVAGPSTVVTRSNSGSRPAPGPAVRRRPPAAARTRLGPSAGGPPPIRPPAASRLVISRVQRVDPAPTTATAAIGSGPLVTACRHTTQRVAERGRRVESPGGRAAGPAAGAPAAPAPAGAPARPPMQLAAHPPQWRSAPLPDRPPGPDGRSPQWSADDEQPRIDVERLADQVVRRIDERVIAHRERLGRI